jgi:hypothetical protein
MNDCEMICLDIDSNVFVRESHEGLLAGFKLGWSECGWNGEHRLVMLSPILTVKVHYAMDRARWATRFFAGAQNDKGGCSG